MSDIPKSERSESPLRAQHQVYQIRKKITTELMATFGYSQKRFEKHIKAVTDYLPESEREERAKRIRELEEDFDIWYIQQERGRVLQFCQDISIHRMRSTTTSRSSAAATSSAAIRTTPTSSAAAGNSSLPSWPV